MLCTKCGKNNATTHYKSVINGKVTEEHLCSHCAENLNISSFYFPSIFSSAHYDNAKMVKPKRCDVCGCSFNDIKRSGKAGCSNCYQTFKEEILPSLSLIHGSNKHVKSSNEPKENPIEIKKAELQKAIMEERFEDAAKIRDEIKNYKEHQ